MKRLTLLLILVLVILIVSSLTFFGCSVGRSPITTQASMSTQITSSIKQVKWNLSGTVMPQPEYGSRDVSGEQKVSVLTVDQTEQQVQITGEMSALNKNTSYTVLLANGYTPKTVFPGLFTNKVITFTFTSDPTGAYRWTFILLNNDFPGPGTYTLSIWIKETDTNTIVLISDNFDFTIK